MRQALSDISVVEVGTGVSASWCGKVLADLGADVFKIEPPGGDPLRRDKGVFAHLNTNKRSVVVEPPDRAARLGELIAGADLVIEASGQGTLRDWEIDRSELLGLYPALSVVAISGFGATGPYADYAWSDLTIQAFTGSLISHGAGPLRLPMSVCLCSVGHTAAFAGLASVLRSRATGEGAFVDCSAAEAMASVPMRMGRHLGWDYRDREDLDQLVTDSSTTLLPLGTFPCADGYVAMMMTPQQLSEMLDVIDSDELREFFARPDAFIAPEGKEIVDGVLYPWLLTRTRQEITDRAQSIGWPVAPVHDPSELLTADHLHQRGFWIHAVDPEIGPVLLPGPPYRLSEGGWKLRRAAPRLGESDSPSGAAGDIQPPGPPAVVRDRAVPPLKGLRVLDVTTVWSGPLVTMHLADLGAEVIRVESPQVFPPTTRGYFPRPDPQMLLSVIVGGYGPERSDHPDRPYNRHSMYNSVNRGKRACTLDVRDPEQRKLFFELVAQSDIFVENLKVTTLHQMGIHETELLEANPRMIVLRIPAAGLAGDWSHYTGFGGQFDGLTGFASLLGHLDAELMDTPSSQHMDSATGPAAVLAVLAALHYRAATGRGQLVEFPQSENVLAQLGDVFTNLQLGEQPRRYGNRDRTCAPQGIYSCSDERLVAITITTDEAWRGLCEAIGRPDLAKEERFAQVEGRHAGHAELDQAISGWASGVTAYQAFHALQQAGVAAAPYLDERRFFEDPHVVDRGWIRPLANRDVGTFTHLGQAFRGIPLAWEHGAPALGEDNEYVFKELLGLDDTRYQELVARRIATEDYLDRDGNPY